LIGEAKLSATATESKSIAARLKRKIENFPVGAPKEKVPCLFLMSGRRSSKKDVVQISGKDVLAVLR
jgi:hypothetical protein